MPQISRKNKIVSMILVVIFTFIVVAWFSYFIIAAPAFDKETAVVIHDAIIQGISGLGSVAIAVIIFRIQSLENRNEMLENSTLNYISQTFNWTYPDWTSSVEDDIKNETLTNRYYARLPTGADELVVAEKERQQKRLEEALGLHDRIQATINRMRTDIYLCAVFLILPILLSLLLLLVVNLMDLFWNFVSLSTVVLMCSLGILLLIRMVWESTST